MGIKDHDKYYDTLSATIPNTVSRNLKVGDRSFSQVVFQSGKPILDAELNANQNLAEFARQILGSYVHPSGIIRTQTRGDGYNDFLVDLPSNPDYPENSFRISKMQAVVAGFPLVLEYTDTINPGENLITLDTPRIYDGTPGSVKRTDFVFLEVWQTLVAASPRATGTVTVSSLSDGDTVTIDGVTLTAKLVPALATDFLIGGTDPISAANLVASITANIPTVIGGTDGTGTVTIAATTAGLAGNAIPLVTAFPLSYILSGPLLTGGADRVNKPAQDKIYRHGNVQSPSATWLDDDLNDPIVVEETAQRVQIQYRFRHTGITDAVNFKIHPDGFTNVPTRIEAQGSQVSPVANYYFIPADGSSTAGLSDASAYGFVDDGLWIAGDGSASAASDLGTLDGYVYAIPITFVFRRNDASDPGAAVKGFDPLSNTNGGPTYAHAGFVGPVGVIPPGDSDRPDGAFADVINANDFLDLRRHVMPSGINMGAELQYQMQSLLDGNFRTWAIDTASKQQLGAGSGDVSTRFLVANEIGRLASEGGTSPASGTTTRGETIRNFDHIARRFGDQPVTERVVVAFYPGDRPDLITQGGPVAPGLENPGKYVTKAETGGFPVTTDTWYENDILHWDLTFFDATTEGDIFHGGAWTTSGVGLPGTDVATFLPPGSVITDVLSIYHDDGNYTAAIDQTVQAKTIVGLGTHHVEIALDANDLLATGGIVAPTYKLTGSVLPGPEDASPRRIFVEFQISYPLGVGTTDTPDVEVVPTATVWPNGPVFENDISQQPTDMENILKPAFRGGFREIQLEYIASENGLGNSIGTTTTESLVSRDDSTLVFPRRIHGEVAFPSTVFDVPGAILKTVDTAATEYSSSSRQLKLTGPLLSGTGQTLCNVTYFAQDPLPNFGAAGGGYQVTVYYRSNAPQTAGVKEGAITTDTDGTLPTVLNLEPLILSDNLWTSQRGMGSVELGYPYLAPMDQIPINDNLGDVTKEWYFAATALTSIGDFDATTGMLSLHTFVQADGTENLQLGGLGVGEPPIKDAEFRAYYPFADDASYRPAVMSQPLSGSVRHKVWMPFLARATETVPGASGGILFRQNEILLVVLCRFAELDEENTVRFVDTDNVTCAGVYRTKNLLLIAGA